MYTFLDIDDVVKTAVEVAGAVIPDADRNSHFTKVAASLLAAMCMHNSLQRKPAPLCAFLRSVKRCPEAVLMDMGRRQRGASEADAVVQEVLRSHFWRDEHEQCGILSNLVSFL